LPKISRERLRRGSKPREKVLVIVGPHASGKSDLAIRVAMEFKCEVVSADSRQIYRGLNIGSGKVTKEEMQGIPHHLVDVEDPKNVFTVSDFQKKAKRAIHGIVKRGKLPIVAGGSGLYVDALIYDMKIPVVPPQVEFRKELEKLGTAELLQRLNAIDPDRASSIDYKNKRRLVRAVEIVETTGEPIPALQGGSPYDVLKLGVKFPDEELRDRIYSRLDKRREEGVIEEVRELNRNGLEWDRLDNLGLEYRYIARYLQGVLTHDEMVETLETEIWRYAKRQMTWFKRDDGINWLNPPIDATSVQGKVFPIVRDFLAREDLPSSDR